MDALVDILVNKYAPLLASGLSYLLSSRRWCPDDTVRLLTPFDSIVYDRRRFEIFWGWPYRFEACTPAPKLRRVNRL